MTSSAMNVGGSEAGPGAPGGRALVVAATPMEGSAIAAALGAPAGSAEVVDWRAREMGGRADLLITGVGKANAAAGVARAMSPAHGLVVSAGVAGALPGSGLALGSIVAAESSIFADEGLLTPEGFEDVAAMGFGPGAWWPGDAGESAAGVSGVSVRSDGAWLRGVIGGPAEGWLCGPVATVSMCSGTDAWASATAARTGGLAEAMEGAAVGFAATRIAAGEGRRCRFVELRSISNTTGDRPRQAWDLRSALRELGVALRAASALW